MQQIKGQYLSIEGEISAVSSHELLKAIEKIEKELKARELADYELLSDKFHSGADDLFKTFLTLPSAEETAFDNELKEKRIADGFIRNYEFERGGGRLISGLVQTPSGKIETTEIFSELTFDPANGDDGTVKGLTKVTVTLF